MDIKSQIAPKGLEFKPSEFIVSDKYATVLTAISYPKYINPGFLSNLTSMSGIKMVIKHIPMQFDVISKMINKEVADLKVRYQEENDLKSQHELDNENQEINNKNENENQEQENEHEQIQEVVVAGVPDAYRGETVKAYIVKKAGATLTEEELDAYARKHLAAYKVPRLYEFRDELPKTAVGKILRRALVDEEKQKIAK